MAAFLSICYEKSSDKINRGVNATTHPPTRVAAPTATYRPRAQNEAIEAVKAIEAGPLRNAAASGVKHLSPNWPKPWRDWISPSPPDDRRLVLGWIRFAFYAMRPSSKDRGRYFASAHNEVVCIPGLDDAAVVERRADKHRTVTMIASKVTVAKRYQSPDC